jgi:hypothetical protein
MRFWLLTGCPGFGTAPLSKLTSGKHARLNWPTLRSSAQSRNDGWLAIVRGQSIAYDTNDNFTRLLEYLPSTPSVLISKPVDV